jgi:signal transduction histidine kinase
MGRLASAVAHEVRNPLGVILAQTKVLEKQGAASEGVAEIRAQVERARRFLDDLLRFAKPRPLALRELDVRGVLAMAASNVRQALGRAAAERPLFHLDGPDGSPDDVGSAGAEAEAIFIEADRGAVLDVATILLTNAAIAIEDQPDGVVRATVRDRGRTVEIAISDNGPGVPARSSRASFSSSSRAAAAITNTRAPASASLSRRAGCSATAARCATSAPPRAAPASSPTGPRCRWNAERIEARAASVLAPSRGMWVVWAGGPSETRW